MLSGGLASNRWKCFGIDNMDLTLPCSLAKLLMSATQLAPTEGVTMYNTAVARNERGRITGIMAKRLDQDKLADVIADELSREGNLPHGGAAKIEPMDAVVVWSQASLAIAVVNEEGVGAFEEEDHVRVWFTYGKEGMFYHDVLVPVNDILEARQITEEVDLADFIRTFGARLDSNHELWARWALGE